MMIDINGEKPDNILEENWKRLKEISSKIFAENEDNNEKLRNKNSAD
jgi:hypothetical protein